MALPKTKRKPRKKVTHVDGYVVPIWANVVQSHKDYANNLHWAMLYGNYVLKGRELKGEVLKYLNLKKNSVDLQALKGLEDWRFELAGKRAWILNNEGELPEASVKHMKGLIDALLVLGREHLKVTKKVERKVKKVYTPSIQERIADQVSDLIGHVETEVDAFVTSKKFKHDFDMYAWLQAKEVKGPQTSKILAYYENFLNGLDAEEHEYMGKAAFKRFTDFVTAIVEDTRRWKSNKKATRKVRTAKTVSASKQVAGLKYLAKSDEHKLVSVAPENILGAQQVWLFNAKDRGLVVYNASAAEGFTLKGTTLQGWDPETSEGKIIRKPEEVLPGLLKAGKIALRKFIGDISTKSHSQNGRINKNQILVRVVS